jgi:Zn-dependent alcohol dehydrogenase
MVASEKTIKGSFLGSCVPDRDIPELYKSIYAGISLSGTQLPKNEPLIVFSLATISTC